MINEFGKQLNSTIGVCVWPTAYRRLASTRFNVRCKASSREGEKRASWPAADRPKVKRSSSYHDHALVFAYATANRIENDDYTFGPF